MFEMGFIQLKPYDLLEEKEEFEYEFHWIIIGVKKKTFNVSWLFMFLTLIKLQMRGKKPHMISRGNFKKKKKK